MSQAAFNVVRPGATPRVVVTTTGGFVFARAALAVHIAGAPIVNAAKNVVRAAAQTAHNQAVAMLLLNVDATA